MALPLKQMSTGHSSHWLVRLLDDGAAERVVYFPHAGGAPSHGWPLAVAARGDLEVWAAQLPGRERRFMEPPVTSLAEAVPDLSSAVAATVAPPFTLFGHSMGGLLAFEVARWLEATGGPAPSRLVVSASVAPQSARPGSHLCGAPDEELLAWLGSCGGMPAEVLAERPLLDLLLPVIRADLTVTENYVYRPGPPLSVPITAIAGVDDPLVSPSDMAGWRRHTAAGFAMRTVPGGHFHYQSGGWAALIDAIREVLRPTDHRAGEERP